MKSGFIFLIYPKLWAFGPPLPQYVLAGCRLKRRLLLPITGEISMGIFHCQQHCFHVFDDQNRMRLTSATDKISNCCSIKHVLCLYVQGTIRPVEPLEFAVTVSPFAILVPMMRACSEQHVFRPSHSLVLQCHAQRLLVSQWSCSSGAASDELRNHQNSVCVHCASVPLALISS